MTVTKTRAALAALLLTSTAFAFTAAQAQDDRGTTSSDGSRFERKPPAKAPTGSTLSSSVGKPLNEVIADINAKKFPEALAAAKTAQAAAKTDYEKMKVNQFLTIILVNTGDNAGATAAAEAAADTPQEEIPAEDRVQVYSNATSLALNAKHNDKALTYARAFDQVAPNDPKAQDLLGRALYAAGDPSAPAFFAKQVDGAVATGKVPSRDALQMLMIAQIKAKDEEGAEKTMIKQVRYYNDPADWKQIIDVSMSTKGVRDIDALQLGRLLFTSGGNVSKDDADLIGQTAQKMALYGDAQQAQAKGATLQMDPARVAADKADVPKQITLGASQNGLFNIKLAEALYGYGMYAEAESVARTAQAKGGADASEITTLIGMAQIQQGKYADGVATLATVQGGGPVAPRVAELWTAYAKNKGNLPG